MVELVTQMVLFAAAVTVVAFIMYTALTPRYQFIITIQAGEVRVTKGKVPAEFLDNLREACREFNIISGWIGCVARGKSIALRFSRGFPPSFQQRVRNMWFCP